MDDKLYLEKLGERISKLRLDCSMRQIDLADKIGIEDSALRRIEKGRVNSSINMLRKIAKGLDISLLELLDF
ncbi:MAG: helix-turn-helix transcriptional regulator [Flavobacteriales bacterium]|nr:helix-turn-helix transcriptional regulator [Flavobacteriales bacterium]MCB9364106.1 helix-turn-helix transcriptional regulator [Flavobacteriales bacterium]